MLCLQITLGRLQCHRAARPGYLADGGPSKDVPTSLLELSGKRLSNDRRIAAARHSVGSNILYLDGHAGYRAAKQIRTDLFRKQKP